jgi:glycolate oxidase iron-sulfur subunit
LARALYFTGCATDLIYEDVGHAVVKVLTSLGIELLIPREQVCCSVPIFLSGARTLALPNIQKNIRILDRADVDFIVVDCATCGGGLKKSIPHLLEDLGKDAEPALRVAAKVKDVSELVADRLNDLQLKNSQKHKAKVTYHDPCHLVRSMKVLQEPRSILSALESVELLEMAGADQCCGGAGSFQFEHIEISEGVTTRKKHNIRHTNAHVVATGCPGCRLTLAGNLGQDTDPKVMHTIQLVARELP